MRLPRKRPPPAAVSPDACRFVGISTEPGRGAGPDTGLYQFFTPDGVYVSLHETDCTSLTYTPGPDPTLTARFRFDPDWTPPELVDRPVVVLRFRGAHLLVWDTDADEEDTYRLPDAPGGQVSTLDWDGDRMFALGLLTIQVVLTAHTVEVSTEAAG